MASVWTAIKNMFVVLANVRFVAFLLIFSGFFIVFWQQYISMPLFIRKFVDPTADVDLLLSVDAIVVICLQIAVAVITRKMQAFTAMTVGLLITSLAWIILAIHPTVKATIVALVFVALGEITQVSRYYEYVSRLAPSGQQGLYMGYAFLPVALGYFMGGPLGGYLVHHYGDVLHRPEQMWWWVSGVGVFATILMVIYNKIVKPDAETQSS